MLNVIKCFFLATCLSINLVFQICICKIFKMLCLRIFGLDFHFLLAFCPCGKRSSYPLSLPLASITNTQCPSHLSDQIELGDDQHHREAQYLSRIVYEGLFLNVYPTSFPLCQRNEWVVSMGSSTWTENQTWLLIWQSSTHKASGWLYHSAVYN